MTRDARLGRLERSLGPDDDRVTFRPCSAPAGLSREAHDAWHAAAGVYCFTLNLGNCQVETNR